MLETLSAGFYITIYIYIYIRETHTSRCGQVNAVSPYFIELFKRGLLHPFDTDGRHVYKNKPPADRIVPYPLTWQVPSKKARYNTSAIHRRE